MITPDAPLDDPDNFQNVARRTSEERGWFLTDQFRFPINADVHERTTGSELVDQTDGRV